MQRPDPAGSDEVVFDQIDRLHRRAREIAYAGTGPVTVISSQDVLSFIEITPSGNPIVYSIFARLAPGSGEMDLTAELLAVESSHIMGFHEVTATQSYGSCRVVPA